MKSPEHQLHNKVEWVIGGGRSRLKQSYTVTRQEVTQELVLDSLVLFINDGRCMVDLT